MLYIRETFGSLLRTRSGDIVVLSQATMQTNLLPGILKTTDQSLCFRYKNLAPCPISGINDSRKRHEMCLISKLGIVHSLGINERFCYIRCSPVFV